MNQWPEANDDRRTDTFSTEPSRVGVAGGGVSVPVSARLPIKTRTGGGVGGLRKGRAVQGRDRNSGRQHQMDDMRHKDKFQHFFLYVFQNTNEFDS